VAKVVIALAFSDGSDISSEIKTLFTRTNVLCRRFKRCSLAVKVRLFRTFCVCFYDAALWTDFTIGAFNRLASEPKKHAWRHGRAWKMKIRAWKNQDPCFKFYKHIYAFLHKYPV